MAKKRKTKLPARGRKRREIRRGLVNKWRRKLSKPSATRRRFAEDVQNRAFALKFVKQNLPEWENRLRSWEKRGQVSSISYFRDNEGILFSFEIVKIGGGSKSRYYVFSGPGEITVSREIVPKKTRTLETFYASVYAAAVSPYLQPDSFLDELLKEEPKRRLNAVFPLTTKNFVEAARLAIQCAEIDIRREYGGPTLKLRR